jgi:cytosine-specific methyltransferase
MGGKIMNVISLFSGCGGLDLGFERAGFNIPVLVHASVKRMLSNKKYLGTDHYPQIIDKEIQTRFLEESSSCNKGC